MNVVAMGRAGLAGPRARLAGRVAPPLADHTALSEEQVEAIIGAVFLLLALFQFVRLARRVWAARNHPA